MNRDNNNRDRAPLWFRYAYKAATAPRRVKIGVVALATAAAAVSYIYFLQADADKNKTVAEAATRTPADHAADVERVRTAYAAIGQEPPEDIVTAAEAIQPPTEYPADAVPAPSEETAEENPDKVPGWIVLALAVLGYLGVRRVVNWTEKEGYTVKRFEDFANRNSKKRKDDPEP